MFDKFQSIILALTRSKKRIEDFCLYNASWSLKEEVNDDAGMAQARNVAFLITLSGDTHPKFERAVFSTVWPNHPK